MRLRSAVALAGERAELTHVGRYGTVAPAYPSSIEATGLRTQAFGGAVVGWMALLSRIRTVPATGRVTREIARCRRGRELPGRRAQHERLESGQIVRAELVANRRVRRLGIRALYLVAEPIPGGGRARDGERSDLPGGVLGFDPHVRLRHRHTEELGLADLAVIFEAKLLAVQVDKPLDLHVIFDLVALEVVINLPPGAR